jgi:hypothetical protein
MLCACERESPADALRDVELICRTHRVDLVWRAGTPNAGNNLNRLIKASTADFLLLMNDDCVLKKPLDLMPEIELLAAHPEITAVFHRADGCERCPENITLLEQIGPCRIVSHDWWVVYDSHVIVRGDFREVWGPYLEDAPHGMSEEDMNGRLKNRGAVVVAPDEIYFEHIGEIRANGTRLSEKAY